MFSALFSHKTLLGRTLWPIALLIALVLTLTTLFITQSLYRKSVESVETKATLGTQAIAAAAVTPVWDLSVKQASQLLLAAAPDPDFVAGTIYLDNGTVFASFGNADGAQDERTFAAPITQKNAKGEQVLGHIEMVYSLRQAHRNADHAATQLIVACLLLFFVLIALLVLILRAVTRPIVQMTSVMEQLAHGHIETEIPQVALGNELTAMAKAMTIFKNNALELFQMIDEQQKLRLAAEKSARLSLFLKQIVATSNLVPDTQNLLAIFLGTACKLFQWPIGHIFVVEKDHLHSLRLWYLQNRSKHGTFKRSTEGSLFKAECGLPGRAWHEQRAVWIEDSREIKDSPRLHALEGLPDIFSGVAIPIAVGGQVRYVIEMIADTIRPTDEDLLSALNEAATYLSWMIERLEKEKSAAPSQKTEQAQTKRAPMYSVLRMLSLVLDTELAETHRNRSDITRQSAESVVSLMNDLLDISTFDSEHYPSKITTFNLHDLIESIARLYHTRAQQKGMAVLLDIAPDVPAIVQGDFTSLRQILLNLLGNAVKYTAEGHISVHVDWKTAPEKHFLSVVITDTGPGFSPERMENVWSGDESAQDGEDIILGSPGLGLSVSKKLVYTLGGTITLGPIEGRESGAMVRFAVPLEQRQPEPRTPYALSPPPVRPHKILVLNPYECDRNEALWAMAKWGIDACFEKEEQAFISAAKERKNDFTVLLCPAYGMSPLLSKTLADIASESKKRPWIGFIQPLGQTIELPAALRKITAFLITPPLCQPSLYQILHYLDTHYRGGLPPAPVTLQTIRNEKARALRSQTTPTAKPRILVVDDQTFNLILMESLLTRYGCEAETTSDPREAIEKAIATPYDIIFMDCQMPEISGFEATAAIRKSEAETGRHTPIIAFTANIGYGDRETCLTYGMDDYIPKPIKSEKVREALHIHLGIKTEG